jgi:hypothetical protein
VTTVTHARGRVNEAASLNEQGGGAGRLGDETARGRRVAPARCRVPETIREGPRKSHR